MKGKKKRRTEEQVGRQYQRMDRNDFASSTRAAETGQEGKGLLLIHLRCPNDLQRLWDGIK